MKIINEKGKLFGLINIIDLIVLIVIAALIFAGTVFIKNGSLNSSGLSSEIFTGPQEKMIIKYYQEEVSDFVIEHLEVGTPVYDDSAKNEVGTLIGFETTDAIVYNQTSDGQTVTSTKEGYKSLTLITEVSGMRTPMGATVNNNIYSVGHTLVIRAGDAKLYPRVYDIDVVETEDQTFDQTVSE